jgi:hypothetical protein
VALSELIQRWIAKRDDFARYGSFVDAVKICDAFVEDLQAEERTQSVRLLNLKEASAVSGLSPDHIGFLIRRGTLQNFGRKHAPRVSAADLPRRPLRQVSTAQAVPYDAVTDARSLKARR